MFGANRLISITLFTCICIAVSGPVLGDELFVTIDGQDHCTGASWLTADWITVDLGPGETTFTLTNSDFGSSPGAENHLVFIMLDQIDPADYDYWLFSLNGIGDAVTVTAGRAFIGFIDTGADDNHGTSTVSITGLTDVVADGQANCAEIPDLRQNWLTVTSASGYLGAARLTASSFGSSPGAENHFAFVMLNQIDPLYYDYWLFTVNGIGDEVEILASQAFVGFVDTGCGDNHGESTLSFDDTVPVAPATWGLIKALY